MASSRSSSPLWHLQFPWNPMNCLHMFSKCCRCRWRFTRLRLQYNDFWHLQCCIPVLFNYQIQLIGHIPPRQMFQFVKRHLILLNTLHALRYQFGGSSHHLAGFIIFAQLTSLWIVCSIILICTILLFTRTWKIAQTVSDSNWNSSNAFMGFRVVKSPSLAYVISSSSCFIAVSVSGTLCHFTGGSPST